MQICSTICSLLQIRVLLIYMIPSVNILSVTTYLLSRQEKNLLHLWVSVFLFTLQVEIFFCIVFVKYGTSLISCNTICQTAPRLLQHCNSVFLFRFLFACNVMSYFVSINLISWMIYIFYHHNLMYKTYNRIYKIATFWAYCIAEPAVLVKK